ncbi:MBL fold metallo-hydrolase [Chitinophaga ginsengisoli]|uniref:L-ascorbate metabolism protein UlaG (Beta-lactamase superfamily) n=1 Tax=Chitinophaga ginsengisoli TaxID=363837 RepID=A0A2P8FIF9_9BACT|nr:MBL fold metallo-hydrolase [Chitinophaga ginsengisoli]PSL21501.1 L-ascorbate metabolism protein UlaG (beta-lactamase superfamily) [Chitinophaga ginsengisoli]
MENEVVYLRPNVVLEPLVDKWYAWTHLIYPPTAAMNILSRHLRIMSSYVQAPQVHAAAIRNPKMLGGPFMNYETNRAEDIKQLIVETKESRKHMLELAEAIKDLDNLLQQEAHGFSLDPLYEKVPDILKGLVEISYDLHNNPGFRFFEQLMYKSEYYNENAQSLAMWLTTNDERPFVLSTARLKDTTSIELNIPFSSSLVDRLHHMRTLPGSFAEIKEALDIADEDLALFQSFFTTEAPPKYERYTGDKIRMRYFGHACILVETKEVSILVDPVISYYGYQAEVERFSYSDLPEEIDYILITHNHQDHILFETMLYLRHKVKKIIVPRGSMGNLQDPNLKLMFNMIGFHNVVELEEMESITFGNTTITGLPFLGEHGDLNIRSKLCYHVRIGSQSMLFLADSCNIEPRLYEHVVKQTGPVDIIFLGMECDGAPFTWVYGPLMTEEIQREKDLSRRLAGSNFPRGQALVNTFKPRELYVYAMGLEPWIEFISSVRYHEDANPIVASNKLITDCGENNIAAERLFGEKELLYEI